MNIYEFTNESGETISISERNITGISRADDKSGARDSFCNAVIHTPKGDVKVRETYKHVCDTLRRNIP